LKAVPPVPRRRGMGRLAMPSFATVVVLVQIFVVVLLGARTRTLSASIEQLQRELPMLGQSSGRNVAEDPTCKALLQAILTAESIPDPVERASQRGLLNLAVEGTKCTELMRLIGPDGTEDFRKLLSCHSLEAHLKELDAVLTAFRGAPDPARVHQKLRESRCVAGDVAVEEILASYEEAFGASGRPRDVLDTFVKDLRSTNSPVTPDVAPGGSRP
jgi:hypothetical protein